MGLTGINKVILVGNLGKDPEVRKLEGGAVVASFPLATTENYKDKNGNKMEQTEWHNIVLWRAQAEFAEKQLKKGNTVMIEGKIRTRSWEDKEKNKRQTTEILGDSITLLIGNKRDEGSIYNKPDNTGSNTPPSGDLPF